MKKLEEILINKRIRPTPMRLLVLEYLQHHKAAINMHELESNFDHADRVTLYRTIKTFEQKGLLHRIIDDTEVAKYGLCSANCNEEQHHDTHVHFYCHSCRQTFCLPSYSAKIPGLPDHFTSDEISLLVKGICAKCNE